ncbi:hypothetical protein J2S57_005383 [Kineosporia succinea]|uniref:Uncharacterized protein n=1 Tax=Kineosporia succinea TaxID=84632 RepID=A0ABT9PB59_9ACTN|nr:hypothetical protein [Kineosporia succinea]
MAWMDRSAENIDLPDYSLTTAEPSTGYRP